MTDEQIDAIIDLVNSGQNVEWWDWIDGNFKKILGITSAKGELAVGYDYYMNAEFVIDNSPNHFSAVEFYDQSPEDFFLVERTNIFIL